MLHTWWLWMIWICSPVEKSKMATETSPLIDDSSSWDFFSFWSGISRENSHVWWSHYISIIFPFMYIKLSNFHSCPCLLMVKSDEIHIGSIEILCLRTLEDKSNNRFIDPIDIPRLTSHEYSTHIPIISLWYHIF